MGGVAAFEVAKAFREGEHGRHSGKGQWGGANRMFSVSPLLGLKKCNEKDSVLREWGGKKKESQGEGKEVFIVVSGWKEDELDRGSPKAAGRERGWSLCRGRLHAGEGHEIKKRSRRYNKLIISRKTLKKVRNKGSTRSSFELARGARPDI